MMIDYDYECDMSDMASPLRCIDSRASGEVVGMMAKCESFVTAEISS